MAEVLGAVASGISIVTLAAQIAASVVKLKSYWNQIKDAPEDIMLLIDELDDLRLLLCAIEKDQSRNPISSPIMDDTVASRCLEHCRRGADRLQNLVDELSTNIYASNRLRSKWASTKVVLKKDDIKKYKTHLKAAIRLLSL